MGRQEGWLNCDLTPAPNIDHAFDCQGPWPFPEHSAGEIYSSHMLEHLSNPWGFFREAYRVLQPNGTMLVRVPYGGHHAAWWDLTHIRPWFAESFAFVQPGYNDASGNPQHDDTGFAFGIQIVQMRVSYKLAQLLKKWWVRKLFRHHAWFFDKEVEELWVHLFALKTPEARTAYRLDHEPHIVPSCFTAWKHHLTGGPPPTDGSNSMVDLANGITINGFIGRVMGRER